ncbi:hypothetical protein KIN20_024925, partial [Parelaphostrongylus tenuis]
MRDFIYLVAGRKAAAQTIRLGSVHQWTVPNSERKDQPEVREGLCDHLRKAKPYILLRVARMSRFTHADECAKPIYHKRRERCGFETH